MPIYRRIAGTGTTVGSEGAGSAAPGQPSILSVHVVDGSPDALGNPQKRVTLVYAPPDPVGTFSGVWVYLDAPDTAYGLTVADGTTAADGTQPESGTFEPEAFGFFPFDEDSPTVTISHRAPTETQHWRVYLCPGSDRRTVRPIQAGKPGESVSRQFPVLPPATDLTGREVAPLIVNPRLASIVELGWQENPRYEQAESGDQYWRVCVDWDWPESDQNYAAFGGVNLILDDGTTQYHPGNVDKGAAPRWMSSPFVLKPGTTIYRLFLISYSVQAVNNTLFEGITPEVTFTVTRSLGSAGVEYTSLVTQQGSTPFVSVNPIVGADGTEFLRVTGVGVAPSDPTFGGFEIVVKKPSDANYYTIARGRLSPIEADISQPSTVATWRFYLRSIDINGRPNTIKDNGDGVLDPGETPWTDVSAGNPNGRLNLTRARTDTFSNEFQISSGALRINQLSAATIVTGQFQVGGGGSKVSIMKVFDTLNSLIGWVGDDTGVSGFVGAWFKQLRIGGASPSSAAIVADASGNVTISTSLIVGTLPHTQVGTGYPASALGAGTAPSGVSIQASSILAGTISASITMTSPSLVISGGSGWGGGSTTINMDATNRIKLTETGGVVSYLSQLSGAGLTAQGAAVGNTDLGVFLYSSLTMYRNANIYAFLGMDAGSAGGEIRLATVGASIRVRMGTSGSYGFLRFNEGSHYALWTDNTPRKFVCGIVTLSSGAASVSTGLSSISSAGATHVGSGSGAGTPANHLSVGASGGTLSVWSTDNTSSHQVCWWAYGQP